MIAYTVYDKVTYIKPDFEIDAVTDCGFSYNSADTIANSLASSGALDDINGDGKIKASVSYYTAALEEVPACRLLCYLYENSIGPEQLRDVLSDFCGRTL